MRGCLIIHGLTETPVCIAPLRERLLASGFKVAAPCLAGHSGTIDDLARSTWQQWYETVRAAYTELRRNSEKIYYVGTSLGTLLGLKLALDEGWGVRALALLGTPIVLKRHLSLAHLLVRYTPLRYLIHSMHKDYEQSVHDPEGRLIYKASSIPRIPANSVMQLFDLEKHLLKNLRQISNPILMIHAKRDHLAPLRNLDVIKKGVSSEVVETMIFEKSGHVIHLDREREEVANQVVKFFERFA